MDAWSQDRLSSYIGQCEIIHAVRASRSWLLTGFWLRLSEAADASLVWYNTFTVRGVEGSKSLSQRHATSIPLPLAFCPRYIDEWQGERSASWVWSAAPFGLLVGGFGLRNGPLSAVSSA